MEYKPMQLPSWMIHQSFRYCLGRRTYAVGEWVQWAVNHWDEIPDDKKQIICREIKEEFEREDRLKRQGSTFSPLGDACDRSEWEKILNLCNQTGE